MQSVCAVVNLLNVHPLALYRKPASRSWLQRLFKGLRTDGTARLRLTETRYRHSTLQYCSHQHA